MSAPERIWATSGWKRIDQGKWWDCNPGGDAEEYVRADLSPRASLDLTPDPRVTALVEALERAGDFIDCHGGGRGRNTDLSLQIQAALAAMKGGDA